jgi:hypothetical protein
MVDAQAGIYGWTDSVVITDPVGEVLEVVAAAPGPAGVSSVRFPDGTVWEVDHAYPGQLVRLELAGDLQADPVARLAVGEEGVLFLADRSERRGAGSASDPPPVAGDWGARSFGFHPDALLAGRLVVLADLAQDGDQHPLACIAAAVELATAKADRRLLELFRPVVADALGHAARLAEDLDDELLGALPEDDVLPVARVLDRVGRTDRSATWARALADRLRRSTADGAAGGGPVAVTGLRSAPLAVRHPLRWATPRTAAAADVAAPEDWHRVERVDEALVRVEVARSERARWARVYRVDGLVLLGQAPVTREGLVDGALVVVPPTTPQGDLRVVVVDADEVERAGAPLEGVRAAVRAGRRAMRASRLHQYREAGWRWELCAEAWSAIGDGERAELARALAGSGGQMRRLPGLLADPLAEMVIPGAEPGGGGRRR